MSNWTNKPLGKRKEYPRTWTKNRATKFDDFMLWSKEKKGISYNKLSDLPQDKFDKLKKEHNKIYRQRKTYN